MMVHSQTQPRWPGRASSRILVVFSVPNSWVKTCCLAEVAAMRISSPTLGVVGMKVISSSPLQTDEPSRMGGGWPPSELGSALPPPEAGSSKLKAPVRSLSGRSKGRSMLLTMFRTSRASALDFEHPDTYAKLMPPKVVLTERKTLAGG